MIDVARAGVVSRSTRPAFLVVDDDNATVIGLQRALSRRFGADYEVLAAGSPEHGLSILERVRGDRDIAIVIAGLWMTGMTGTEFLVRAHQLHPTARRALIATAFDFTARDPILQAMALGRIDTWLLKPWQPADHHLYPRISDLLDEWVQATEQPGLTAMRIVADPRAPRTHELREVLDRNNVPVVFVGPDTPEGRRLLDQAGHDGTRLPVIVYFNCLVQVDPPNVAIAEALGVATRPEESHYDVTVVGAGPAGMSAAVCSASEGLHTLLLEPHSFGGQASSTSMIRNYLGFPRGISGRQLTQLASDHAVLFGPKLVFDRATRLDAHGPERLITLGSGAQVSSDAIVISVGAEYHRLSAPGVEELLGAGVFYGGAVSEAAAIRGQPVYVVGGGNSAGQAAVYLAEYTDDVSLLVRGSSLASTMSDYLIQQIAATPTVKVRLNAEVIEASGASHLEYLTVRDLTSGRTSRVPAAALFILIGARPNTGWLTGTLATDTDGFLLTGPDLPADRARLYLETNVPGVFAAGDVRHGSAKRVASAVGEGANAVQLVQQYLRARIAG
jgi:thioredoxin reductase (NADPH)